MPVTKKKETYSEAMARLEKIVSQIDNNELEIDVLAEKSDSILRKGYVRVFCHDGNRTILYFSFKFFNHVTIFHLSSVIA